MGSDQRSSALTAGCWRDHAEAAYAEAIHARPRNESLRDTLARFHIECGHPERAAAALEDACRMMPENFELVQHLSFVRLWMGDIAGLRKLNAELLDRFGRTNGTARANEVAWACPLGPDGAADPQAPVRLAKFAVRNLRRRSGDVDPSISNYLNTLAAALYRAGQYEDAIRQLEQAVQAPGGAGLPYDWVFLAMAHHRLGHRDDALRFLDRLRDYQPSADPGSYWRELQLRLLRNQAEVVILYDPAFPADPLVGMPLSYHLHVSRAIVEQAYGQS